MKELVVRSEVAKMLCSKFFNDQISEFGGNSFQRIKDVSKLICRLSHTELLHILKAQ